MPELGPYPYWLVLVGDVVCVVFDVVVVEVVFVGAVAVVVDPAVVVVVPRAAEL
ncbi:MAG: hypothetical protein NDI61_00165 [Bdellovibrionaceae bacterium]|nr:hypothetical protein [Pseudobdellovibrionaceae bacterium]